VYPAHAGEKKPTTPRVPRLVRQDLDCTGAVPIACDDVVLGNTTLAPSNVEYYSCSSWLESGPEVVHELVPPGPESYMVFVDLDPVGCDLDVFQLGDCDEGTCIEFGDVGFAAGPLAPGTAASSVASGCSERGRLSDGRLNARHLPPWRVFREYLRAGMRRPSLSRAHPAHEGGGAKTCTRIIMRLASDPPIVHNSLILTAVPCSRIG